MCAAALAVAIEMISWLVVGTAVVVLITQALGRTPFRTVALLQSMNPQLTVVLAVIALGAAALDVPWLGVSAALAGIACWISVVAAIRPLGRLSAEPATALSVASVNLLYKNRRIDRLGDVLSRVAADVVFMTEFTDEFAAVLGDHEVASRYPYRLDDVQPDGAGSAVWSRLPFQLTKPSQCDRDAIGVLVDTPRGEVAMLFVHPFTPVESRRAWQAGLDSIISHAAATTMPLLVVGDFNATYWHPAFRRLRALGFRDAHVESGRGLSASWRTDLGPVPPMLRLDHALTGHGLAAVSLDDFDVPGSDHLGLLVSVGVAG